MFDNFDHGALAKNRVSAWIGFGVACIAATMMHPTGASLFALILIGIGLFVMRLVAHHEARWESHQIIHDLRTQLDECRRPRRPVA